MLEIKLCSDPLWLDIQKGQMSPGALFYKLLSHEKLWQHRHLICVSCSHLENHNLWALTITAYVSLFMFNKVSDKNRPLIRSILFDEDLMFNTASLSGLMMGTGAF